MGQQAALVLAAPIDHTGTLSGLYGQIQLLTGAAVAVIVPAGMTVLAYLALGLTAGLIVMTISDRALLATRRRRPEANDLNAASFMRR